MATNSEHGHWARKEAGRRALAKMTPCPKCGGYRTHNSVPAPEPTGEDYRRLVEDEGRSLDEAYEILHKAPRVDCPFGATGTPVRG